MSEVVTVIVGKNKNSGLKPSGTRIWRSGWDVRRQE